MDAPLPTDASPVTASCPACGEAAQIVYGKCAACGERVGEGSCDLPPAGWRAITALGFGTTVAMWAVAYVCRLPAVQAPAAVLLALFVLCLLGGGLLAGRWLPTMRPLWAGAWTGGVSCLLNLLILGSVLADGRAQALTWIPGTLGAGALLGAAGAFVGRATRKPDSWAPTNWLSVFTRVALLATLLLIAVGGIVTGAEAGLAVPDWPNTYTSNMFVYPLSRMTGGIYYEHAHRLFGSLVGLTTLVLAIMVWTSDERGWLRALATGAFALVCVQGLLGGLRVTGGLTLSTNPEELSPSQLLALIHGINGQAFFALLGAIAAFSSTSWFSKAPRQSGDEAEQTLGATTWLVGLVFCQLVLGALVRHFDWSVTWHVTLAVVVVVAAGIAGVRARSAHADLPVLPLAGLALLHAVGLQFLLGVGALATTADPDSLLAGWQVPVTTAHQTCGALVLVSAVILRVWAGRFLTAETPKAAPPPSV